MLFAADEAFWKSPNVYDVVGLLGFVLALASIWLSWWLAKRDIEGKIETAKRAALGLVDRMTTALVQTEVADALRCMRDARDAMRRKDWGRMMIRLDDVEHHLSRIQGGARFSTDEMELLSRATDTVSVLRQRVAKLDRPTSRGDLSQQSKNMLEKLIAALAPVESRLRGLLLEGDHV